MTEVKSKANNKNKEAKPLEDFYGFKVLPVIVKDNIRHFMYMTQHEVRSASDTLPADRTLFLVNLPIDTTDAHLQYLFRSHGSIASIVYHGVTATSVPQHTSSLDSNESTSADGSYTSTLIEDKKAKNKQQYKKRKHQTAQQEEITQMEDSQENKAQLRRILHSGASAHVIFTQAKALSSILAMTRIIRKWEVDEKDIKNVQPLGFQRYMLAFEMSRPDHGELQEQVDSYMMKFKENEYQKERELLQRMNQMDDDGFVVVSRHKKKRNTDGEIQVTATSSVAKDSYDPSKAKKKELVDFYRFQLREKKQNELLELRKRFEEDKVKIDRLKQSRKFRPF
ncbi:ribosomal RNA-processing protein 7-domain-containing protein [Absidia repens]|uniref:Ribosomal RNA-processing protein 7-domain-containing protein n=1 Tax=Absidia repens TaxID=90262 RepID=A0A1X2IFA4_9FUNG|nr:ribosomal RNA-processing protein 7-domain-containing protein [Absidia repens]